MKAMTLTLNPELKPLDQVFVELGLSLKAMKAIQSELDHWMRLGSLTLISKPKTQSLNPCTRCSWSWGCHSKR